MDDKKNKLKKRLETVWESPDFSILFTKILKKPFHKIKKGTVIFNEGDPLGRLYYIKEGYVKIYRVSKDGKDTTSHLLGPGYILGVRALLSKDECAIHTAEAITDLNVITISRDDYFNAVLEHPELLVDLIHIFMDRLTYTERKVEGFITADTTSRVANFLVDCAGRFGEKSKGEIHIPLELTHQRIAEFVGSFRETVTLAIHKLENDDAIRIRKGKVVILDLKKLKKFLASKS